MTQGVVPPSVTSPSRRGTPATNDPIPYFGGASDTGAGGMDFFNTLGDAKPNSTSAAQQPPSQYSHQQHYQPPQSYQASSSQIYQQQSYQQPQQQVQAPVSQPYMGYQQYQQYQQTQQYQLPPRDIPPRSATGPAVDYPYQGYGYASHAPNHATTSTADPYRSTSVVYGGMQYNGAQYGYQQQFEQLAENPLPVSTSLSAPIAAAANAAPADGVAFFDQLAGSNTHQSSDPAQINQQPQSQQPQSQQQQPNYSGGYYPASQINDAFAQVPTLETTDTSHYGYASSTTASQTQQQATQYAAADGQGDTDTSNGVIYDEASGQYYDTNSGQYYDNASGTWYYPQQPTDHDTGAYEPAISSVAQAVTSPTAEQAQPMETASKVAPLALVAQTSDVPAAVVLSRQVPDTLDGASFFDDLNTVASAAEGANGVAVLPQTVQHDSGLVVGQNERNTPTDKDQVPDLQQPLSGKVDMDHQGYTQEYTASSTETHPPEAATIITTQQSTREPIANTGAGVEVPVVSETIEDIDAVAASVSDDPVSTNSASLASGTLVLDKDYAAPATAATVAPAAVPEMTLLDSSVYPAAIGDDVTSSDINTSAALPESNISTSAVPTVATEGGSIQQVSLAEPADMADATQPQQYQQQQQQM
ncbi:hypothetical protein GGI15_003605, partial [Coemansia interrupta]